MVPARGELSSEVAVLSRVISGKLNIDSYDVEETEHWAGSGQIRKATYTGSAEAEANTPSFLLTPNKGNIHAFRAPVACAVFDVLVPPYDPSQGRRCSYFRVASTSTVSSTLPLDTCDTVRREEEDFVDKNDNNFAANTVKKSTNVRAGSSPSPSSDTGNRHEVLLEEIPEPNGLPGWSEYRGPRVIERQR